MERCDREPPADERRDDRPDEDRLERADERCPRRLDELRLFAIFTSIYTDASGWNRVGAAESAEQGSESTPPTVNLRAEEVVTSRFRSLNRKL